MYPTLNVYEFLYRIAGEYRQPIVSGSRGKKEGETEDQVNGEKLNAL